MGLVSEKEEKGEKKNIVSFGIRQKEMRNMHFELHQISFLICEKCLINCKTLECEFQGKDQQRMEM